MVEIKTDIIFVTLLVSYFAKNRNYQHVKTVKIIFKYLKDSKCQKICYKKKEKLKIDNYLDLDQADDQKSQRFISRFIFILISKSISLYLKKQVTIALLSKKVEYIILTQVAKEAIWL